MRKFVKLSVLPIAAFAVACGRGKSTQEQSGLSADLKRDLAAASASGVELASNVGDYKPTRFVSAIESPSRRILRPRTRWTFPSRSLRPRRRRRPSIRRRTSR